MQFVNKTPALGTPGRTPEDSIKQLFRALFQEFSQHATRLNGVLPKDGTEVMNRPLPLASYATADLPDATLWEGSIVYDLTTQTVKWSNGTAWATI